MFQQIGQFLKDFGPAVTVGGAAAIAAITLIIQYRMKRRDERLTLEIRVELAPRFEGDKDGLFDRMFIQIRNQTTRAISVQATVFHFGRKGEARGHWDRGPDGRLLSPEDVERDKATNLDISVDDFVKAFDKRIGDTYALLLRDFRKTVSGFIQIAGTTTVTEKPASRPAPRRSRFRSASFLASRLVMTSRWGDRALGRDARELFHLQPEVRDFDQSGISRWFAASVVRGAFAESFTG